MKKYTFKRFAALSLAAVMAVSAGCGSSSSSDTTEETTAQTAAETEAETAAEAEAATEAETVAEAETTVETETEAAADTTVSSDESTEVSFAELFADPTTDSSIKVRVWWPSAEITDEEIAEEVADIAAAGFGGIELIGISESYDADAIDAEIYGWSTEAWNHAVSVLEEEAEKYGLSVDLTIGPRWPAGVPGLDLDSDASSKEVVNSVLHIEITDTDTQTYTLPEAPESEYSSTFVALVAARTDGTLEAEEEEETEAKEETEAASPYGAAAVEVSEYGIYSDSLTLISEDDIDFENGTFTFAADETGEWTFFAFYYTATAQTSGSTSPTAYVIDHFSTAGTEAMLSYWEENMLTDDQIEYWAENGGNLFEDSLELDSCDIPWSVELEDYFSENMGYDIDQYLPLLIGKMTTSNTAETYTVLDNDTIADEIYSDFFNNLSDMYIENHLQVIAEWCESYNVEFRVQAQGTSDNGWVDTIEAATYVDVIEGETLGMGSSPDAWRSLAGAANMSGTEIVSVELGADFGALYQVTWQRLSELLNRAAMAGANQFVLHGYATDSQTTSYNTWPGWMPFDEPEFSEGWGSRQPSWDYMEEFTEYASRLMVALQYGTASVDFAVYRDDLGVRTDEGYTDGVLYLDDETSYPTENAAVNVGYTYNYISPGNFDLDTAVVEDGVLNPEYAGYQALVINNEETMALEDAEKILEFAQEGLVIILIGETPTADGTYSTDADDEVQAVFEEMLTLDNVYAIDDEDDLPDALLAAGVTPSASYDEAMLAVQHRQTDDADIYYIYNYTSSYDYQNDDEYFSDDAAITTTITLEGNGQPYMLDPWTGEITAVASYTDNGDGTISMEITVEDGEAILIGISADSSIFGDAETEVLTTDVEEVSLDNNTWTLDVISYEPGELALDSESEDYDPTDIAKVALDTITLDSLTSWDSIEGLEDISGQGTYTTTFTLEEDVDGAVIDLGLCYDNILEITVNGTTITGINQITHEVDLGDAVTTGENTITITVGTTLAAAVRAAGGHTTTEDHYTAYPTTYGLLGGITVTGYTVDE